MSESRSVSLSEPLVVNVQDLESVGMHSYLSQLRGHLIFLSHLKRSESMLMGEDFLIIAKNNVGLPLLNFVLLSWS